MRTIGSLFRALYDRLELRANRGSVGVGLIGIGGWGGANAISIMRSRRFHIAGVLDSDEYAASRFVTRFKTQRFASAEAMLADTDIDSVCITVPNHLHGAFVRAAADAGKAIFVEKPLASTAAECRALGEYCAERRVVLQVGHQMRREPVFREVKRLIDGGDLGTPIFSQGMYTQQQGRGEDWRNDAKRCPGGSVEQIGVHLIDTLIYLHGLPTDSYGWSRNIPRRDVGPDWGHVSLAFEGGVRATVSTSYSAPRYFDLRIFCTNGIVATDGERLFVTRSGRMVRQNRIKGISGSVSQFIEFANCIEHGAAPETGAAEALAVMNVIQSMNGSGSPDHGSSDSGV